MRIFEIERRRLEKWGNLETDVKMEIEKAMTNGDHRFNILNDDTRSLSHESKRLVNSSMHNDHSAMRHEAEPISSISADQLAKLFRDCVSNKCSMLILDCRPIDAFNQAHCAHAKHISTISPPTLLFNRHKGKPDFWSGIWQKIIDSSNCNKNSIVVLIDDDQGADENGRCPSGQRANQPFSSFVLGNLRNEGCHTRYLEKGAMTHFLADYPDLCVVDERRSNGDGNEDGAKDKNLQFAPVRFEGDTTRRPCNSQAVNGTTPTSSLLSKRQSSSSATTAPFLLPLLKLKDLSVKQDSPSCNSSIQNDSSRPTKDASMKNCQPLSPTTVNQFDYEKCSPRSNLSLKTKHYCDEGGQSKSANDRDPVNIYETLYLGNAEHASDLETLRRHNIKYILNVTSDLPNRFENQGGSFKYLRIPIVDNVSQNLISYFPVANGFIDEAIERKCGVLVHCLAGISRSVTFTLAYLMKAKQCSLDDAYDIVKARKPNVEPNLNFMRQLYDYQRVLFGSSDVGGDVTPDSAVSSLSTSSSSSVCVGGQEKEPLITSDSDTAS